MIGKDTRRSGYMFENALTAGLTSTGMEVLLLSCANSCGWFVNSLHACGFRHHDFGKPQRLSRQWNQIFGPDGFKLSDEAEEEIERLIDEGVALNDADSIGRAQRIDDGMYRYVERAKSSFPSGMRLDGMKVVVDCANGAAYRAAPECCGNWAQMSFC